MIAWLRFMSGRNALTLLLTAALLSAALFAVPASSGERRFYQLSAVERAIESQGVQLLPIPPAESDPSIRSISSRRYLLGSKPYDPVQQETITIYAFPTEAERSKGEGKLRAAIAAGGSLPPVVFGRGNILVIYRPLAIVNQSGTKYGELLRAALASL